MEIDRKVFTKKHIREYLCGFDVASHQIRWTIHHFYWISALNNKHTHTHTHRTQQTCPPYVIVLLFVWVSLYRPCPLQGCLLAEQRSSFVQLLEKHGRLVSGEKSIYTWDKLNGYPFLFVEVGPFFRNKTFAWYWGVCSCSIICFHQ